MNDINRAGLNRVLQRNLTIKGDVPPAPIVGAEIVPVMNLENDRPEWGYLGGEKRCFQEVSQINVAGQVCKASLENPAGSGVQCVLESLSQYTGSPVGSAILSTTFYFKTPAADYNGLWGIPNPTNAQGLIRDLRWSEFDPALVNYRTLQAACKVYFNTSGVGSGGIFIGDLCSPIFVTDYFVGPNGRIPEIILPPGWAVMASGAVNTAMCTMFCWRERPLEPNEVAINPR